MNDIVAHFQLKRYPFEKDIKTSEAVDTTPIRECLARLEYMKRRCGLMALTGDAGVGKTMAMRRFVDSLNENLYRALYTPLTTLKGADLLRHINDKLGLPNRSSKAVLYRQIQQELLESREQRGRTVLLIIDEAQLLQIGPLQELRLLTNFKMDSCNPFILILAGQSDLRRVLDYAIMEPLAQRLSMRYHMPPLAEEETAAYIQAHMKLAGATETIFTDDAMAAIHELSFGLPRRIGNIAKQALTYAMFAQKQTVDADAVFKANAGG